MNREQRRKQNNNSKQPKQNKVSREVRDALTLNRISSSISNKVKQRLIEIRQTEESFKDIKHVQVNYFNIEKLGLKYQKGKDAPVGMYYGDAVVKNTQTGDDQPEHYLCINVLFDENKLDASMYQVLLGLTSKVHNWRYSKDDDIYIDQLGVYVDRLDIEEEVEAIYDKY